MGDAINMARSRLRGVWSSSPVRAAAYLFLAYLFWKHWGGHIERYLKDTAEEVGA